MGEDNESIIAILQRLEKTEKTLERIDLEHRKDDIKEAAFDVRWDHLAKEYKITQAQVIKIIERLDSLESAPIKTKAQLWNTVTGRVIMIMGTAIGTILIAKISAIIKLLLEAK
jgi:ABC-type phosphate transport system auxiliary subunit